MVGHLLAVPFFFLLEKNSAEVFSVYVVCDLFIHMVSPCSVGVHFDNLHSNGKLLAQENYTILHIMSLPIAPVNVNALEGYLTGF